MDLREIVAANIRRLRLKRGLSQVELARRAKIDRPYLNRLEKGAPYIGLKNFGKIAEALGVGPAELLTPPAIDPTTTGEPLREQLPPATETQGSRPVPVKSALKS